MSMNISFNGDALTQGIAGLKPFALMKNFFVTELTELSENISFNNKSFFVGPLIPLFWTSGDISSEFQSCYVGSLIQTWQRHT